MLEVLHFIFRDVWTFLGTWLLLATIANGLGGWFRINIRKGGNDA